MNPVSVVITSNSLAHSQEDILHQFLPGILAEYFWGLGIKISIEDISLAFQPAPPGSAFDMDIQIPCPRYVESTGELYAHLVKRIIKRLKKGGLKFRVRLLMPSGEAVREGGT